MIRKPVLNDRVMKPLIFHQPRSSRMSDATYNNKILEAEADESNSEAFVVSDEFIN